MKILKWATVAVLALVACVLVLVSSNALGGSFLSSIAERLPFVNNFIVKTFPTYLFASTREDVGVLKVARYDIDFLASFTGNEGRYVALYPFTVEAELDLERIQSGEPFEIDYTSSLDEKTAASMVFMNTLSLDYNSELSPVLAMYRERSLDLARDDAAFTEDARAKAESYVTALLGDVDLRWADEGAPNGATTGATRGATEVNSRFLPVAFRSALDAGRTSFAEGSSLRDAFVIRTSRFDSPQDATYRFGKAGTMLGSFDAFAEASRARMPAGTNRFNPSYRPITFRYHDPVYVNDLSFTSRADEGYRTAFVYFRGSTNVYYVDSVCITSINDEARSRNVAPVVLFLAASAKPSADAVPANVPIAAGVYETYWRNCESALGEIRKKQSNPIRYGRDFTRALEEMNKASFAANGTASPDAAIMRELVDLDNDNGKLLELVARSLADASVSATASGDDTDSSGELSGNVAALLWTMRDELGLSPEVAEGYRRDLLSKGAALSRVLVRSLSAEERNTLYAEFFARRLRAGGQDGASEGDGAKPVSLYVGENGDAETWLYWGQAANDWKTETTQIRVAGQLEKCGMERGGKFILVFADGDDKAGFFTDYNALVFDAETVTYYKNFARWIKLFASSETAKFTEIQTVDGSFVIDSRVVGGKGELASILGEFARAFSSDAYNRDRVVELLSQNLEREALAVVERPSFGR